MGNSPRLHHLSTALDTLLHYTYAYSSNHTHHQPTRVVIYRAACAELYCLVADGNCGDDSPVHTTAAADKFTLKYRTAAHSEKYSVESSNQPPSFRQRVSCSRCLGKILYGVFGSHQTHNPPPSGFLFGRT